MKEKLVLDHALLSAALPEMPQAFEQRARALINALPAERTEPMKRKLSVGLILAIALALISLGALAAALLSPQEVVEQVLIPIAKDNDTQLHINDTLSPDELAAFIRACEENGFSMEENQSIMDAFRQGQGYSEEETIMAVCRQAFGGSLDEWTLAQRHWFWERMKDIGWLSDEEIPEPLPGPEEPQAEAVRAAALAAVQREYGEELPLADAAVYRIREDFTPRPADGGEDPVGWVISFLPRDIDHDGYIVYFDRKGGVTGTDVVMERFSAEPGTYTVKELFQRMSGQLGDEQSWSPQTWHRFRELAEAAIPWKPEGSDYLTEPLTAYMACAYPLPEAGELSQEEAVQRAQAAAGKTGASVSGAILSEYDGRREWLISLTYFKFADTYINRYETCMYEVDARTGELLGSRVVDYTVKRWARCVPGSLYEKIAGKRLNEQEATRAAAQAINALLPEPLPLEDEDCFRVYFLGGINANVQTLEFRTKKLEYATCRARVDLLTGEVEVTEWAQSPLTADNILTRYREAHGFWGEWPQRLWAELSRSKAGLEAQTLDGKILQATEYPDESAARITRAEAEAIVFAAEDCHFGEINSCILIAAEPHPIWKLRLLPYDGVGTPVYEVDAETGEVLNRDQFTPDNTDRDPTHRLWSLHSVWARLEWAEQGNLFGLATSAVFHTYGDMGMDDPAYGLPLEDDKIYTWVQEDNTVRFTCLWSATPDGAPLHDYLVSFDSNGVYTGVEELPPTGTEPAPAEQWDGFTYGNG